MVLERARILTRLCGGAIDFVALGGIFIFVNARAIKIVVFPNHGETVYDIAAVGNLQATWNYLIDLAGLAIAFGYVALDLKALTLGKIIFRMRIANEDGSSAPLSRLLKRWVWKNMWLIFLLVISEPIHILTNHLFKFDVLYAVDLGLIAISMCGFIVKVKPIGDSLYDRMVGTRVLILARSGFPITAVRQFDNRGASDDTDESQKK